MAAIKPLWHKGLMLIDTETSYSLVQNTGGEPRQFNPSAANN